MTIEETSRQIVENHYHESLDDMKYPSARKLHANIQEALQQQKDEIVEIIEDHSTTPRVRHNFCEFCGECLLEDEACSCPTDTYRQYIVTNIIKNIKNL